MAAMRPLTALEQTQILAALKQPRDRLIFLFGRYTGFRIGEILSVRVNQVWRSGAVADEITVTRSQMKAGKSRFRRRVKSRSVPLHPELKRAIQTYIQERSGAAEPDSNAMLFPSAKGNAITPRHAWSILREAAQVLPNPSRVGPHSLRKIFATDLFQSSGHNLPLVQRALGHANIMTTISYLSPSQDDVTRLILGLGEPAAPNPQAIAM